MITNTRGAPSTSDRRVQLQPFFLASVYPWKRQQNPRSCVSREGTVHRWFRDAVNPIVSNDIEIVRGRGKKTHCVENPQLIQPTKLTRNSKHFECISVIFNNVRNLRIFQLIQLHQTCSAHLLRTISSKKCEKELHKTGELNLYATKAFYCINID